MYVGLYVRIYVCICVYVCIYVYVCMHVCHYVCMHACMYVCMYVEYVCMYVCMYECKYVCVYVGAVPWLRRLVAGLPPRRPGFDAGSVHVGFVCPGYRCSITRKNGAKTNHHLHLHHSVAQ
jgi:hypothetical protein